MGIGEMEGDKDWTAWNLNHLNLFRYIIMYYKNFQKFTIESRWLTHVVLCPHRSTPLRGDTSSNRSVCGSQYFLRRASGTVNEIDSSRGFYYAWESN